MDSKLKNGLSLAIINNIPACYHSSDLRNYFSQFIESGGFNCFHFRHRPELKTPVNGQNKDNDCNKNNDDTKEKRSTCCVVKLETNKLKLFMKMYHRKHWIDKKGEIMSQICYISKVKLPNEKDELKQLTRGEQRKIPADRETFTESDLHSLPELRPPDLMPHGNVGTPTKTFMDYIKQCRLPPSIIKKLGLSFPRTRTSKMYGSVPFDYGGDVVSLESEYEDNEVLTGEGHEIVPQNVQGNKGDTNICNDNVTVETNGASTSGKIFDSNKEERSATAGHRKGHRRKKKQKNDEETKRRMKLNIEENMIGKSDESEGDNDSCEEWERHEALYDDVSNQERNKERLFEEEIELKWEKGGSGLVFYTDAQYWQAQEGDFDEQTADDYDVDMSGYYEEGAGDKDARDSLAIRQEKRRRDGIESTDRFTAGIAKKKHKTKVQTETENSKIGKFEAYTKGIGRKILEEQGWSEGQGLGSTVTGMADALDNDGQNPRDRRGFGYRGEKLVRHFGPAQKKVIISTVYDNPAETDPHEPLLRRFEPYHLKYREEIQFDRSTDKVNMSQTTDSASIT